MKRNLDIVSQETGQPSSFIYHIFRSPVPGAELINLVIDRQECFSGKKTTRKVHKKLHLGLKWRIFHILTSEDIDDVISCFYTVVHSLYNKKKVTRLEDIYFILL